MTSNRRVLTFVLALSGCLDMSPLDYQPIDLSTLVPMRDASAADRQTISSNAACDDCLFSQTGGSGCAAEMDACLASPTCKALVYCALSSPCFSITDPSARNICLFPCATDAGVISAADPILMVAFAVQNCAEQKCPSCSLAR